MTAGDVLGSLLPNLCCPHLVTDKVLTGCFPCIRRDFSIYVFLHILQGTEDKIDVTEEILVMFFGFLLPT